MSMLFPKMPRRSSRRRWWVLAALVGVVVVMSTAVFPWRVKRIADLSGVTDRMPDGRLSYTPAELDDLARRLGESGRQFYALTEMSLDVVFPLSYGAALVLAYTLALDALGITGTRRRVLIVLALLVPALDLTENACLIATMKAYPPLPPIASVASVVTTTKWLVSGVVVALLAGLGIAAGMQRFRRPRGPNRA